MRVPTPNPCSSLERLHLGLIGLDLLGLELLGLVLLGLELATLHTYRAPGSAIKTRRKGVE